MEMKQSYQGISSLLGDIPPQLNTRRALKGYNSELKHDALEVLGWIEPLEQIDQDRPNTSIAKPSSDSNG